MKKALLFLLALCVTAGITMNADAAMRGKHKGKGMGKGMDRGMMGCCMEEGHPMMKKLMSLGLDDRQKESVRAIHMKMKKEEIRGEAEVEVAEIELKEVLMKDPVDLKAAEAKLKQIETMKTGLRYGHIKAHEEVKAVLTPEQRKKFNAMMMEMGPGGMMHGHGGMGMRHGEGMGRGMKGGCGMMGGMGQSDDDDAPDEDRKEDAAPPAAGHQH
jgi:Spy/CpxP family protein refolding chaperone